jgi:hypothetical protein
MGFIALFVFLLFGLFWGLLALAVFAHAWPVFAVLGLYAIYREHVRARERERLRSHARCDTM